MTIGALVFRALWQDPTSATTYIYKRHFPISSLTLTYLLVLKVLVGMVLVGMVVVVVVVLVAEVVMVVVTAVRW
jgi:hypothetical protein